MSETVAWPLRTPQCCETRAYVKFPAVSYWRAEPNRPEEKRVALKNSTRRNLLWGRLLCRTSKRDLRTLIRPHSECSSYCNISVITFIVTRPIPRARGPGQETQPKTPFLLYIKTCRYRPALMRCLCRVVPINVCIVINDRRSVDSYIAFSRRGGLVAFARGAQVAAIAPTIAATAASARVWYLRALP